MTRPARSWPILVPLTVAAIAVGTGATDLIAQQSDTLGQTSVPSSASRLVVKLVSQFEDAAPKTGAGIIVGARDDTIFYIATARHNLLSGGRTPEQIRVYFSSFPLLTVEASTDYFEDSAADLAIITVPQAAWARRALKSFNRRGNVGKLSTGDPVKPVGCPQAKCWDTGPADQVIGVDRQGGTLLFASFFVRPGSSGGALFNDSWEVVGMVVRDRQPIAEAIAVDTITASLDRLDVPKQLKPPFVPRKGYRTTIGVTWLTSKDFDALDGRIPGFRANLLYQVRPVFEIHAAAIRLTPENLSVTGGMAGFGFTFKVDRVILNPFLEGGFARLEGRYDIGGFCVDDGPVVVEDQCGQDLYAPVWQQVKDDKLGFGAGLGLQAILVPHVILELLGGYWAFSQLENAPEMPDLFFGGGFRFGF